MISKTKFLKTSTCFAAVILLGAFVTPAEATKYYYAVEQQQPFFWVTYPNDKPYGGTGRGRFVAQFSAVDVALVADDVTRTVTMSGTMTAIVQPGHENIGPLEQLFPGTWSLNVKAQGVTVRNPLSSAVPFELTGGTTPGHGLDGSFTNLDNESKWLYGTGVQDFWGMPFNGTPPAGYPQIANLMFGAQHLGGSADTFQLAGWAFAGMYAGIGEPFMRGDFSARIHFLRADGQAQVPEPATALLLFGGLAARRAARKRISA